MKWERQKGCKTQAVAAPATVIGERTNYTPLARCWEGIGVQRPESQETCREVFLKSEGGVSLGKKSLLGVQCGMRSASVTARAQFLQRASSIWRSRSMNAQISLDPVIDNATAPASSLPTQQPQLSVVDMVWPDQSNHHGTLFGGAALSILDRMAFISASKVLRGTVVTAAVGSMNFAAPAPAGQLVECNATVLRVGQRSVTILLELLAEDLLTGKRTLCLSGEFVMVRKEPATEASIAATAQAISCVAPSKEERELASAMVAEIVFPGHANHRGILHGGPAMEWMVKAGFAAASRQVRRALVLASSGHMDFKASALVGDVVEIVAKVIRVGRRSVHVQTQMWAESPVTGVRRHCTSGQLVFVALPDDEQAG